MTPAADRLTAKELDRMEFASANSCHTVPWSEPTIRRLIATVRAMDQAISEYVSARESVPPAHPGSGGSGDAGQRVVKAYERLRATRLAQGEEEK